MEIKHYYSPAGVDLDRIKKEIVEAISKNPHQDPTMTIEQNQNGDITPQAHLDLVVPLIEMVRSGEIMRDQKEGWKTNNTETPQITSPEV